MSDVMQVAQGIGATFTATIRNSSGNAYTGYTGTELLAGTVRLGRDSLPLFTLTPVWLDHTKGTITLSFAGASTSGLDVGRYLVQVYLNDKSADLYEGFLEVSYSAGTAAALTSYASFSDMLDRAPWIGKLQKETDLAGFARQRYLARAWLEDLLHRHYRNGNGLVSDFYFVPGVDFAVGRPAVLWRDGRRSPDLQGWLDASGLIITEQIKEACSHYAIALLCDRQVNPVKDDTGYAAAARKYFARAEDAASLVTAEIDINGDGASDIVIRLGVADTLEG